MSISTILFRLLILVALIIGTTNSFAVNSPPPASSKKTELRVKKSKKIGIVKKWIIKRLAKRITKKIKAADPEELKKIRGGDLGFIFGLISFILLFAGLVLPWLWLIGGLTLILAIGFSILTLIKTDENDILARKPRKMATVGLILSILTVLIPLLFIILWILILFLILFAFT